ncbi:MAG: hypothetical protein KGL39_55580 [Patescibacteria group bacterium]|nr:hypothetical protein [Patescibacteria group bacterium]
MKMPTEEPIPMNQTVQKEWFASVGLSRPNEDFVLPLLRFIREWRAQRRETKEVIWQELLRKFED